MEPIKFLKEHCEFNEPTDCYVIIAISRKKDTEEITNSKEIVFRDVIKSPDEIEKKYLKIKASITNYRDLNEKSYPFYLYIMLNPGNARKATLELLKRMVGWLEREHLDTQVSEHYKRTYAEFYSCLMVPHCRGSKKYFMIDYDEKDRLKELTKELSKRTEIKMIQETRNGYHIKCVPFDKRKINWDSLVNIPCEIKYHSLMFVEYFENGNKI